MSNKWIIPLVILTFLLSCATTFAAGAIFLDSKTQQISQFVSIGKFPDSGTQIHPAGTIKVDNITMDSPKELEVFNLTSNVTAKTNVDNVTLEMVIIPGDFDYLDVDLICSTPDRVVFGDHSITLLESGTYVFLENIKGLASHSGDNKGEIKFDLVKY